MLAKGTLVQVKKSALREGAADAMANREVVEDDGWLWFIDDELNEAEEEDRFDGTFVYNCKSLATGEMAYWYEDEVTPATMEQTDEEGNAPA